MGIAEPIEKNVAIIIAAYNASATIIRAVHSALAQPEAAEVMVIDDASQDDTASVALEQDDGTGRLKLLVQSVNAGPAAARNRAILESRSPWITILDADDFLLPGRLGKLLAFTGGADLVADDLWQVREENVEGPRRSLLNDALTEPRMIDFSAFVASNITKRGRQRGELGFIKPLMRRSFLAVHGLHYQEHLRLGEDFEMYARMLALGARLILTPAQGYISVWRNDSLSGRHSEQDLVRLRDSDLALLRDLRLTHEQQQVLRRHYLSIDCRLQWRLLIEAVKHKDIKAALKTFLRPYPVPFYLAGQLAQQLYLRVLKPAKQAS